jgi:hypothetical protein
MVIFTQYNNFLLCSVIKLQQQICICNKLISWPTKHAKKDFQKRLAQLQYTFLFLLAFKHCNGVQDGSNSPFENHGRDAGTSCPSLHPAIYW